MLNKMSLLLAAATVALGAGAASADPMDYGNHNNRAPMGEGHHGTNLSVDFGTVAYGYNDGYWDNGHAWHAWRNQGEYRDYRARGTHFHGWNHDRDHDMGWQRH
jgi:hypothetical protein